MAATDSMRSGDCVMFMCVYVPRVKNIIITAVTDSRQQRNEVSPSFAFPFYADECVWDLGEQMTAVTATQADKWIKHRNKQEDAPNRMLYFIKRADTRAPTLFATIDKFNYLHRNEVNSCNLGAK